MADRFHLQSLVASKARILEGFPRIQSEDHLKKKSQIFNIHNSVF